MNILLANFRQYIVLWHKLQNRISWISGHAVGASSINAFKGCLSKTRETRMGFFMEADPLSPRLPRWVFWLVWGHTRWV